MKHFILYVFYFALIYFIFMMSNIYVNMLEGNKTSVTFQWNTDGTTFVISLYFIILCLIALFLTRNVIKEE